MREDAARIVPDQTHPAHLGWARIMVHHQGDADAGIAPEFEGAFSVGGDIYHIMTKHNYLRTKHELDVDHIEVADEGLDSNLVIWRESDTMSPGEVIGKAGGKTEGVVGHGCGHDRLDYNKDPLQNPILRQPSPSVSRWYDNPFGLFNNGTLAPRDDVPSNGMTNKCVNCAFGFHFGGFMILFSFRDFIGQTAGCPTSQKIVG